MPSRKFIPAARATMHDAATVLLMRDGDDGPEVFMMKRTGGADFGGMFVFPGGKVDPADADMEESPLVLTQVTRRPCRLAFWITAVRECFEECGVLFALDGDGNPWPGDEAMQSMRLPGSPPEALFEHCARAQVRLALDELEYFSHWITPEGPPRRYDTRFFIARLPEGQDGDHDDHELIDSTWITPEEALYSHEQGEMGMITPTLATLLEISGFNDVSQLLDSVRERDASDTDPEQAQEGKQ